MIGGMSEPTCEHLALESHPASAALLAQVVRNRPLAGYEPDEWGVGDLG